MMVEFHTGVVDKLGAACGFLHKAHAAGAQVVVCGEVPLLDRLDLALWTFDPLSFVPHARRKAGATLAAAPLRATLWLVDDAALAPAREVLLNLGQAMVDDWQRFARVVEVVSTDPADAEAGRQRWRSYGEQPGVERIHHPRGVAA